MINKYVSVAFPSHPVYRRQDVFYLSRRKVGPKRATSPMTSNRQCRNFGARNSRVRCLTRSGGRSIGTWGKQRRPWRCDFHGVFISSDGEERGGEEGRAFPRTTFSVPPFVAYSLQQDAILQIRYRIVHDRTRVIAIALGIADFNRHVMDAKRVWRHSPCAAYFYSRRTCF